MNRYYFSVLGIILLGMSVIIMADNTVGGSDQPWENDDDDSTMVVAPVNVEASRASAIYDLNGRRISSPQRGKIYIVNGKKIVWKE